MTDPDERTSAGAFVGVLRFAGERRLVHSQRPSNEFHISGNDVARTHANNIAGNQLPRGNELPLRFAQNPRTDLQSATQRFDNAGRTVLLHKTYHGIDNEKRAHHDEVRIFSRHDRNYHDQFEHPGRQAPELAEEYEDRVFLLFCHFIKAVLLTACFNVCT